ncbi:WSC domain-containing protein [Fulvia fulva]|nr:WSC domain-containing protein [Fulvia fulva]
MLSTLIGALLGSAIAISAQDTSIVYPTTAAPTATTVPSLNGYTFAGCWNETDRLTEGGGARALQGNTTASNTLTPSSCISFCASLKPATSFAGLEYGRECYCSNYLSPFTVELNASMCNFACNGNASEICGGEGTISLYNKTGDVKSEGVRIGKGAGA